MTGEDSDDLDPWVRRGGAGDDDDEGVVEYFVLQESSGYMAPTLRFLAVMHTLISSLCVLGYYYLKVFTRKRNLINNNHTNTWYYFIETLTCSSGSAGGF